MHPVHRLAATLSLLTLTSPAFAAFPDTASHPYADAIEYVESHDIVSGYPDGTYKPNQTINRAEFTKIVVGATVGEPPATSEACFTDVYSTHWFQRYVCYAKSMDIVDGYRDGAFRPANTINFAEAAKIIVHAFDLTIPPSIGQTEWYEPYIAALGGANAIPQPEPAAAALLKRGQMAEIIYKVHMRGSSSSSTSAKRCVVGGCSGQLCHEEGDDRVTTCEWREEYACYSDARCERQSSGQCGWTATAAFNACMDDLQGNSGDIEYATFDEDVVGDGDEIVLFFHAEWCPYCRAHDTLIKDWLDDELLERSVYRIDYDTEDDLLNDYDVVSQDTFILLDGEGDEIERVSFPSTERLQQMLQ